MIQKVLRGALGLLVVVAAGACSSSAKSAPPATSAGTSPASITAADSLTFSPGTITVSVGQTVTWKNAGTIGHTVTFDSGPAFNQPLNPGDTVTRTFTAAGTYAYHCSIHGPSMHGTIIVK